MVVAAVTRADVEFEILRRQVAEGLGIDLNTRHPTAVPTDYEGWLSHLFPAYVTAKPGAHHREFWTHIWSIRRGSRPAPFVGIWSRGGGKSTSVEMACVALGARASRRYVLYVCNTQQQADDHVANVAGLLESTSVENAYPSLAERSLGKYGNSRGWRRNRLRTAAGFTVDALGLDTASRGVKLDEQRPDLIVFDDLDDPVDSMATIEKKINILTKRILPTGSADAGALAVQNLVHHEGVFARLAGLASEPADFLIDRIISGPHPALVGMQVEQQPDGQWRITAGVPTWEGQDLERCQDAIDTYGLKAFRSECQHERAAPIGQAFPEWDVSVHVCAPFPIPDSWVKWLAVDYGHAVPFCCLWGARSPSGTVYVYRELYEIGWPALKQAQTIHVLNGGDKLHLQLGDPSMWAAQHNGLPVPSVADQYAEGGVPLQPANNARIAGWERLHQMLEHAPPAPPTLQVFSSCRNLIRTMPQVARHPHKPDDLADLQEDHAEDALRYLIQALAGPKQQKPSVQKVQMGRRG